MSKITSNEFQYQIKIDQHAGKSLKKIPIKLRRKIINRISLLSTDFYPKGVKKLKSKFRLFRIRVEDYRIIYYMAKKDKVVTILRIAHRSQVYQLLKSS